MSFLDYQCLSITVFCYKHNVINRCLILQQYYRSTSSRTSSSSLALLAFFRSLASLRLPRASSSSFNLCFSAASCWQNLLFALIFSPNLINTNGTSPSARLTKPSKLQAHGTPSLLNMGPAANGRTAPKSDREQDEAARAEAAKTW